MVFAAVDHARKNLRAQPDIPSRMGKMIFQIPAFAWMIYDS